MGSEYI